VTTDHVTLLMSFFVVLWLCCDVWRWTVMVIWVLFCIKRFHIKENRVSWQCTATSCDSAATAACAAANSCEHPTSTYWRSNGVGEVAKSRAPMQGPLISRQKIKCLHNFFVLVKIRTSEYQTLGGIIATTRYDTRCYFNVRSKADMSQLNLPHGNDN